MKFDKRIIAVAGAVLALGLVPSGASAAAAAKPDLGPSVQVFTPGMAQSDIQSAVAAVAAQQVSTQFGPQRFALLFEPGRQKFVSRFSAKTCARAWMAAHVFAKTCGIQIAAL